MLLPDTTAPEAYSVAEKVRMTIANTVSPIGVPITISQGISEFSSESHSLDDLFVFADRAYSFVISMPSTKGMGRRVE